MGEKLARKIKILAKDFEIEASLLEEERPETCDAIWDALPFKGEAEFYKEEIYFSIPVEIAPENATSSTERGDISYWPEGSAFCVFFGDSDPVSPVNTFAKAVKDSGQFRRIDKGDKIVVEKVE